MSLLATAKTKVAKGNVKEAFKNEEGAIDLASIMVGIIVIGMIGGVIAATVFSVIPWAQDNAAKQQLDSLASAQSAYVGLASDSAAISFGDATELKTQNLFDAATAKVRIGKTGTGPNSHYVAAKKSASGKIFFVTDEKTQPTETINGSGTIITGVTSATGGTVNSSTVWNMMNGGSIAGGTKFGAATYGSPDPDGTGALTATNYTMTGNF